MAANATKPPAGEMATALRNRVAAARDLLRPQASRAHAYYSPAVGAETMLKYREKLQPLFPAEFFDSLENGSAGRGPARVSHRRTRFVLEHSLHVPILTVANLHVQPGDDRFVVWLFVSSYFPVIAACLAPLGNLISLIGMIEHWQVDPATGQIVPDRPAAYGLEVAAFVLGLVANAALLMNFAGRMRYFVAQGISVACFGTAAAFLLVAVLLAHRRIRNAALAPSEGFWLAACTVAIYWLCLCVLAVNVAGCKMGKYRASFNLDAKQRSLMAHTIAFSVWQAVGTVAMPRLIPGMSFGASLYYCTVSMLTIGLGDIVPASAGAKVFALFFSLVGVLIMGLIVSVLRQVILYSAGPSLFWHHVERQRLALVQRLQNDPAAALTAPDAFARMRAIRAGVGTRQKRRSLAITVLVFISFWLLGALVFCAVEQWSYFNAMYFCFLCLLTIGYGDFHPAQALGRVFFVVWAIAAVPLMTILISNMGDTLFDFSDRFDAVVRRLLRPETYLHFATGTHWFAWSENPRTAAEPEATVEAPPSEIDTSRNAPSRNSTAANPESLYEPQLSCGQAERKELAREISRSVGALEKILADSMDLPDKKYTLEEWDRHLRQTDSTDAEEAGFWLSELSPLRLPLKESNYLLMKSMQKLGRDVKRLVEAQNRAFSGAEEATLDDENVSGNMAF